MSHTAKPITTASDWFAKVHSGNLTAAETRDFKNWLAQDRRNLDEYQQQRQLWALAKDLANDADIIAASENNATTQQDTKETTSAPWRPWAAAIAASILVLATLISTQTLRLPSKSNNTQTYFTQIGEHDTVDLSDGSSIVLNTNSLVEVNYGKEERQIKLIKGEALFRVAKDKARPFKVYAGHGVTTAVGTAFNVSYSQDKTQVDVLEGVVEVAVIADPSAVTKSAALQIASAPQLRAGEGITYAQAQGLTEKRAADLGRINAWQQGQLNFNAMPLAEVVKERNRYSTVNLTIRDNELARLPVSGIFNIGDDQALLFALKNSFNIESKRYGNIIVLSAGNKQTAE